MTTLDTIYRFLAVGIGNVIIYSIPFIILLLFWLGVRDIHRQDDNR